MKAALPLRARFGVFELDLKAGELHREGETILLQQRVFEVLRILVEHGSEIATREDIKKKLWPNDTVVEFDHAINNAIKKLRQILGDSADQPQYIQTLARRGYRLLVAVEWSGSADSSSDPSAAASGVRSPLESLAGAKVSHYRALQIVGGGGMGVVYEAEDLKLGRRVALKFLPPEVVSDPITLERFQREARAASALDHPNICSIYEFGEDNGTPFLAMPLLEGQTLRERLASSVLSEEELLRLAVQIIQGLEAAHDKGIIHRDVKPANIFITSRGEAKILDFGLAKLLEIEEDADRPRSAAAGAEDSSPNSAAPPGLTRTGVALGTASYMSPEQVRGEKLDSRSDLFSFGLVLYEMASGRQAFAGATAAAVHQAILWRDPQPVRQAKPRLSLKLELVIKKTLQKERQQRYQKAAEVREELQRLIRARQTGRRRWLAVAAVLVMSAAAAAPFWLSQRFSQPGSIPEITQRPLTTNSSENPVGGGAISPDGKYLVYNDLEGLHLKTLSTGEIRDVPRPDSADIDKANWGPAPWFVDGSGFLVAATERSGASSMWQVSMPLGTPRRFWNGDTVWSFSPDGSMVALGRNRGQYGDREVWVADRNGANARKVYQADEHSMVEDVKWTADGRRIAYFENHPETNDAIVQTRELSGASPVTIFTTKIWSAEQTVREFVFLPDNRILYLLGENGDVNGVNCNFWDSAADASTGRLIGKPRRLTNWAGVCMDWVQPTANGKGLVFARFSSEQNLYVAAVEASSSHVLSPNLLMTSSALLVPTAWTADGKSVIYESTSNGKVGFLRQSLNEGSPVPIVEEIASTPTSGIEADRVGAHISPDGKWLLYPVFEPVAGTPSPRLMRVPIEGGKPQIVLTASLYDAPRCARYPSTLCVYAQEDRGRAQLRFVSFDPEQSRQSVVATFQHVRSVNHGPGGENLTQAPYLWDLSPDGARIAILERNGRSIHILPVSSGTTEVVVPDGWENLQTLSWTADSKGFFVTSRKGENAVLLHLDLQGRARVLWEQKGWGRAKVIPSPDGRHLAILVTRLNNNVWMMENF